MSSATASRIRHPSPVSPAVVALAGFSAIALWLAADAGVHGPAAVPDTLRALLAAFALFTACGYAPARLLTPRAMRGYLILLVPLFGAAVSAFALTTLGFLHVPLDVSTAFVLASGIASAALVRLRHGPARAPAAALAEAGSVGMRVWWPAYVAALVIAVALIPTMRHGYVTVVGQNGDAELAVGVAELLQEAPPNQVREDLPLDQMPGVWRSKYPIYYALAGVTRLSGLEAYQVFATQMAMLLGLVAIALFLFARVVLRASPLASLVVLALVPLDRVLMHVAIHPFHNQIWGMLSLPLILLFGFAHLREPTRRSAGALALFGALGLFAYPLMLWMPAVALAAGGLVIARARRAAGEPVRWVSALGLPRRRLSRLMWVPLGIVAVPFLLVLSLGVYEKTSGALEVIGPRSNLEPWQGAEGFLPFPQFFGIPGSSAPSHLAAFAVLVCAGLALRRRPRHTALALGALGVLALAVAAYFRARTYGDLFYFKDLAFFGPLALAAAIVWLVETVQTNARRAGRIAAATALAALASACIAGSRIEIADTFDLLNLDLLELRDWSDELPPQASIRLDLDPDGYQLWARHMLYEHPLTSLTPLYGTIFPHPPQGRKADYLLGYSDRRPPADAEGPPLFENGSYTLYEMDPTVPGPDISSRRLIDSSSAILE